VVFGQLSLISAVVFILTEFDFIPKPITFTKRSRSAVREQYLAVGDLSDAVGVVAGQAVALVVLAGTGSVGGGLHAAMATAATDHMGAGEFDHNDSAPAGHGNAWLIVGRLS
jgi:hypothetical protein